MVKQVKTVTLFVAADGKEFSSENTCKDHEETVAIAAILGNDPIHGRQIFADRLKVACAVQNNWEAVSSVMRSRNARLARVKKKVEEANQIKIIGSAVAQSVRA